MKASRSLALCLFGYLACLIVVLGAAAAQDQEAALEVVMEVEAVGVSGPVTEFRAFNSTNFDNHPAKRAYTIAVSPTSGPVGASFAATYTADVVQGAWIGVFASGSSSTSTFKYLTTASGSVTFSTAGLAAGVYRVYLVSSSGTVRASASYTVTTAGTTPMPSPSAAPASSSPSAPAPSTGVSPAPSSSSAPAPSSSSAPAPSAGASPAPSGDAATWLSAHNAKRAQYGMPLLAWSTNLQTSAQNYANTLAAGCTFAHSGGQYGENLAMGHSSIAAVLTAWVDSEAQYYDPVTKTCVGGVCGHFTQVLWRMTSYVGCGIARCASNRPIYVCQYLRPGNCNGYNYESTSSPCGPLGP